MKSQLGRADFLLSGLNVLACDGPRSLTAARMARELEVTTGSFYWHFSTVDEFRDELKRFWYEDIVVGIVNDARDLAKEPEDLLDTIGTLIRQRGAYRYDTAMRSWAKTNRDAEQVVRTADALRGDLIAGLYREAGESEKRARDRSNLFGAAWRGSQDMDNIDYRFSLIGLIKADSDSGA